MSGAFQVTTQKHCPRSLSPQKGQLALPRMELAPACYSLTMYRSPPGLCFLTLKMGRKNLLTTTESSNVQMSHMLEKEQISKTESCSRSLRLPIMLTHP